MKPSVSEPEDVPLAYEPDNAAAPQAQANRPANMKFLYATGDRPLQGYTIKRGVGRGGFGEVYFATSDAGKEVALKLIRRNLDVELRGVRHCLNLKHQNLIGLYDIRSDEAEDQWVVMEYVNGQSLEDVIDAHPTGMPVDQVLWWLRSIAAGVGYLHDHGIVHRDLKPGNIFLDRDTSSSGTPGTVKIGDYGLSKFISCSRRSGQTESVGTVHYMAPEIANGRYGREIDTYALGIILYEMLTGHVPFEGESIGEVLMKHLTAEPNLDAVAEPFREIINRALAKDPELRISSVHDLLSLLPTTGPATEASAHPQPSASTEEVRHPYKPPQDALDTGEHERFAGYDYDEHRHRSSVHPALPKAAHRGVEEPIYAAMRHFLTGLTKAFRDPKVAPPVKAMGIIILLLLALVTFPFHLMLIPIAMVGFLLYCIYYAFWATLVRPFVPTSPYTSAASYQLAAQRQPAPSTKPRPRPKPWREVVRTQLIQQSARSRMTELLGSMLGSSLICVIGSLLATSAMFPGTDGGIALWLSIVTSSACWGVLVINKFTEAKVEDQSPRRAMLFGIGALVGLVAYGVGSSLLLELPADRSMSVKPTETLLGFAADSQKQMATAWRSGSVKPDIAISVIYFALLFSIPRWWRTAEFIRDKRLSLWSLAGLVIAAWLIHLLWWYPQPLGMLVAGISAAAIQLCSPWFPPSKRAELARQRAAI